MHQLLKPSLGLINQTEDFAWQINQSQVTQEAFLYSIFFAFQHESNILQSMKRKSLVNKKRISFSWRIHASPC